MLDSSSLRDSTLSNVSFLFSLLYSPFLGPPENASLLSSFPLYSPLLVLLYHRRNSNKRHGIPVKADDEPSLALSNHHFDSPLSSSSSSFRCCQYRTVFYHHLSSLLSLLSLFFFIEKHFFLYPLVLVLRTDFFFCLSRWYWHQGFSFSLQKGRRLVLVP